MIGDFVLWTLIFFSLADKNIAFASDFLNSLKCFYLTHLTGPGSPGKSLELRTIVCDSSKPPVASSIVNTSTWELQFIKM